MDSNKRIFMTFMFTRTYYKSFNEAYALNIRQVPIICISLSYQSIKVMKTNMICILLYTSTISTIYLLLCPRTGLHISTIYLPLSSHRYTHLSHISAISTICLTLCPRTSLYICTISTIYLPLCPRTGLHVSTISTIYLPLSSHRLTHLYHIPSLLSSHRFTHLYHLPSRLSSHRFTPLTSAHCQKMVERQFLKKLWFMILCRWKQVWYHFQWREHDVWRFGLRSALYPFTVLSNYLLFWTKTFIHGRLYQCLYMSAKSDTLKLERILWFSSFSGWCCTGRPDRTSSLMFSLPYVNLSCHLDNCFSKITLPEFPLRLTHVFLYFSWSILYLKSELDSTSIFSARRLFESAPTSKNAAHVRMAKRFHFDVILMTNSEEPWKDVY